MRKILLLLLIPTILQAKTYTWSGHTIANQDQLVDVIDASSFDTTTIQYKIVGLSKYDDGSISVSAFFNIYGNPYYANVAFAAGSTLTTFQSGMANYAQTILQRKADSIQGVKLFFDLSNLTDTVTIK